MADRPTFVLLTGDLDLAARLQTLVRSRLHAQVVWCATVREVEEHLASDAPAGLLVEVPRRSNRMLRALGELAGRIPTVAITRPHDEPLIDRCREAGVIQAIPRRPSTEDPLLTCLESMVRPERPAVVCYAASFRRAATPPPRSLPA